MRRDVKVVVTPASEQNPKKNVHEGVFGRKPQKNVSPFSHNPAHLLDGTVKFFELFQGKDDNADRVLERVLDRGNLKADPDADVRKAWERLGF